MTIQKQESYGIVHTNLNSILAAQLIHIKKVHNMSVTISVAIVRDLLEYKGVDNQFQESCLAKGQDSELSKK